MLISVGDLYCSGIIHGLQDVNTCDKAVLPSAHSAMDSVVGTVYSTILLQLTYESGDLQ